MKLALLDPRKADSSLLLSRQREALVPIAAALVGQQVRAAGFEGVLRAWRRTNAEVALAFVDTVAATPPPQ